MAPVTGRHRVAFPGVRRGYRLRAGRPDEAATAPLRYLFGERIESSAAAGQMARARPAKAAASRVAGGVSSAMS